jgi:transposase
VTAGAHHEQRAFAPVMERGAVKRHGRGRPRRRPQRVVGDTGYSSRKVRRSCRRHGIQPVIPTKSNERPQRHFNRELYRQRTRVERYINRLKQFPRVATRYELAF